MQAQQLIHLIAKHFALFIELAQLKGQLFQRSLSSHETITHLLERTQIGCRLLAHGFHFGPVALVTANRQIEPEHDGQGQPPPFDHQQQQSNQTKQ